MVYAHKNAMKVTILITILPVNIGQLICPHDRSDRDGQDTDCNGVPGHANQHNHHHHRRA